MWGENIIVKADYTADTLRVKSIFATVQGEGPFCGFPAIFVRLAGCNLRCNFCDTDFEGGDDTASVEICDAVESARREARTQASLVVLTGGEPLIQPVGTLCRKLIRRGYSVQIETAGTVCPEDLPWGDPAFHVICSPKTPKLHPLMANATGWKYVITSRVAMSQADGLPQRQITQAGGRPVSVARPMNEYPVYLSPMDEYNQTLNTRNHKLVAALAQRYGYIASVQMHKYFGVE